MGRVLHMDVQRYGDGVNVLRYGDGGFYGYHHDFIPRESMPSSQWQQRGPRVLTFMLYLNDVRSGGSTSFMKLGHQVTPKAGRALLWANTLSPQPLMRDGLTSHESLRTRKGVKYVATTWLHAFAPPAEGSESCVESRVRHRQGSGGDGVGLFRPPVETAAVAVASAVASASGTSLRNGIGAQGSASASSSGKCAGGILAVDGTVCCAAACGICGGTDCWTRLGGAASCCTSAIKRAGVCCGNPPCSLQPCIRNPMQPQSRKKRIA